MVWIHRLIHCLLLLLQVDEMIVLGGTLRAAPVCTSIEYVPEDLPPLVNKALRSVHGHFRLGQACIIQQIELVNQFLTVFHNGHVGLFEKGGGR